MDTQNVKYTYSETLFSLKRKRMMTRATTWMDLADTVLSEKTQPQKTCCEISLTRIPRTVRPTETES